MLNGDDQAPEGAVALDLGDFDAVGIAGEVVGAVRAHAIEAGVDTVARVAAPEGWHEVTVTGRPGGHAVLGVRFGRLSMSRLRNVAGALEAAGWELDDDGEGATRRFPPGTEPSTVAFDVLAACTVAGAPASVRRVGAVDASGATVPLGPA